MTDQTMNDETLDLLIGVDEIAHFLRISKRQAGYWIEQKRIPIKRMGRTITARKSRLLATFDDDAKAA
jgi:hypothetical protein